MFLEQNSPVFILLIFAVIILMIVMMVTYLKIEGKYKKQIKIRFGELEKSKLLKEVSMNIGFYTTGTMTVFISTCRINWKSYILLDQKLVDTTYDTMR